MVERDRNISKREPEIKLVVKVLASKKTAKGKGLYEY